MIVDKNIQDLIDKIQQKALWLRGEQAYKEFPGFVINLLRQLQKDHRDGRLR